MDPFQRCVEFEKALSLKVVDKVEPWRYGQSLTTPGLPDIRDFNFLFAERDLAPNAVELVAEAEEVQSALGLPHRKMRVMDEAWGNALAGDLGAMGWKVDRFIVMVYEGPKELPDPPLTVRDLPHSEYKVVHGLSVEEMIPGVVPRIRDQIVAITGQMAERVPMRFLAVDDGDGIGSACEIISDGETAQIEAVVTMEASRRKGLARSLMIGALQRALSDHDFVFLVADDSDWPKDFYSRLGFRAVGKYHDFVITDVTGSGEERG